MKTQKLGKRWNYMFRFVDQMCPKTQIQKMEASSYLQVHEPRKTHELEAHHLLEMTNEGARVRVKTQGRKKKRKGEEWEQSHVIWQRNKRETRRARMTNCRW